MVSLRLVFLASILVELSALAPPQSVCKDCIWTLNKGQICELESSTIYQLCRCDTDCDQYRDCCPSRHHSCHSISKPEERTRTRFHCETVTIGQRENPPQLPAIGEQYWMVSTCISEWIEENRMTVDVQGIEKKCINNSMSLPPVTDQISGIVYRNEFCALCNDLSTFVTWDYSFVCNPELRALLNDINYTLSEDDFNSYCTIHSYAEPRVPHLPPARQCYPQIDTCLELDALINIDMVNVWNSSYYDTVKYLCTQGHFQYQVIQRDSDLNYFPYRNEYCALCNGVDQMSIDCFPGPPNIGPSLDFTTPFRIVLDEFGSGRLVEASSQTPTSIHVFCSSNTEVYDPVAKQCRPVVIQDCKDVSDGDNCTQCMGNLIALNHSTSSYVFVNANMLLYNEEQYTVVYNMSNGDPVICVNFSINGTEIIRNIPYPEAYIILSYIGCPVSMIGCILILLTYSIFKELRTFPSLILMQLATAILISNLIILLGGPIVEEIKEAGVLCTPLAILAHYMFLTQFSWMSLMSTEIARKLHIAVKMKTAESKTHKMKILVTYLLLGWCTPLVIVIVTVIVNFSTTDLVLYGVSKDGTRGQCWLNHLESILVSFAAPVAISLAYNAVIFTVVTIFLCVSSHSHSKLSKTSNVPFQRLNVGVFSVSGITWVFGFIAILPHQEWAWIPFIILNSIQGFAIFIAFLGTKRVVLLYISLCCHQKSDTPFRNDGISTKDTSTSMKDRNLSEEKLV